MKTKITRQQRRNMERDMNKKNKEKIENQTTIYGSTVVHLETLKRNDSYFGGFYDTGTIELVKKNDTVCESLILVQTENDGIESPLLMRIIHDSEEFRNDKVLLLELMLRTLSGLLTTGNHGSKMLLNDESSYVYVFHNSKLHNPDILNQLEEYIDDKIKEDKRLLLGMEKVFKNN